jgi:2,3-bisphosphoglycerate-dependent phosphoglycerate mutase
MPSEKPVQLLLVRHGETTWNREGRIQGHRDSPLTERGLAQAEAAAARLARERIDVLYSSDLGRARQTAQQVAAATALGIRLDSGLRERAFGILEGKTWDEIATDHPDEARLLAEDPSHAMPGGESLAQFRDRVTGALRRIAREAGAETIALVTHGGVLGVLYREAMGIPLEAPRSYTTLNAGVNHFRFVDDRWSVVRWGDTDHLEIDENLDDV